VIIMVGAHVTDAWTRADAKTGTLYGLVVFFAGMAAPLFLFLAGLTIAMSASSRAEKVGHREAAALACRRGLQIFALAFLFRLQSQLLGWGALVNFLKVDILNVMGIAMTAAAILWGLSTHRLLRIAIFAIATAAIAMSTPLVREAGVLAALPDPIEGYIRPLPGFTNFALFPWAAFVLCGAIAGEVVFAARSVDQERRLHIGLLISGLAGIAIAYGASFRPSIYPVANFWTSSPTFFFIRAGICTAMLPVAKAVDAFHALVRSRFGARLPPGAPGLVVTTLGRSSLFVYWIHVEMAYGGIARPLKHALPLEVSLIATVLLLALLYQITKWKDRKMKDIELTGVWRIFAPVLR
jgi:uncharacterized membrane protein